MFVTQFYSMITNINERACCFCFMTKMTCQLSADCLNEIFEYLECDYDKVTLHSCLLVNRLWCEISVRILWRDVWNLSEDSDSSQQALLSTLISCLPKESKELLHNNGIFITTPTTKPTIFNYPSFLKVLSIYDIDIMIMIKKVLERQKSTSGIRKRQKSILGSFDYRNYLTFQEILKMVMKQLLL